MIKAVIYDLDDLMVNSDPLHARAWEILMSRHGFAFSDLPEAERSKFIGMRVIDIMKELVSTLKLDVDLDSFYKERNQIFLALVKEELTLMPGLRESLDLFTEQKIPLAIASSGTKEYINAVLDRFKLRGYFKVIISGDDINVGKPHPETYITAAKKLGFDPKDCLVLEDATHGITAAKDAGCKCVAVRNSNTPPQDHTKANLVLDSLKELSTNALSRINTL